MGKRALKHPGDSKTAALDALAERVLEAHGEFESLLHKKSRRFPVKEFDRLWLAVAEYSATMKGLDWLHRDVASVPIRKSATYYAVSASVRRQKRWMLARMSSAVLVQRNGFGSALVASM